MSGVNDAAAPASPAVVPAVVVEHSAEDSAPSVGAAEVKRVTEALETVNPTSTDGPVTEGHPASGATEADTTSSEVPATGGPGATAASDAAATTASPVDDAVTSADAATLAPAAETAPTTTSTKEVSPKKEKEKEKKAGGGLVGEFKNLFRSVSPNKAKSPKTEKTEHEAAKEAHAANANPTVGAGVEASTVSTAPTLPAVVLADGPSATAPSTLTGDEGVITSAPGPLIAGGPVTSEAPATGDVHIQEGAATTTPAAATEDKAHATAAAGTGTSPKKESLLDKIKHIILPGDSKDVSSTHHKKAKKEKTSGSTAVAAEPAAVKTDEQPAATATSTEAPTLDPIVPTAAVLDPHIAEGTAVADDRVPSFVPAETAPKETAHVENVDDKKAEEAKKDKEAKDAKKIKLGRRLSAKFMQYVSPKSEKTRKEAELGATPTEEAAEDSAVTTAGEVSTSTAANPESSNTAAATATDAAPSVKTEIPEASLSGNDDGALGATETKTSTLPAPDSTPSTAEHAATASIGHSAHHENVSSSSTPVVAAAA